MSVYEAIRQRIDKILTDTKDNKVLILDDITANIIGLTHSMDQIVKANVFVIRNIKAKGDKLSHMKALAILSTSSETIDYLKAEIENPKFNEYKIHFVDNLPRPYLRDIAVSDKLKIIRDITEIYVNYFVLDNDFAILPAYNLYNILLGLRVSPLIRYQSNSKRCKETVDELTKIITANKELFGFLRPGPSPLLLIVDRNEDMFTPLLIPDTYQAMISEFCEFSLNKVTINKKEHILSHIFDDFYRKNRFEEYEIFTKNFGEIIKEYKDMTPKAGITDLKQISKTMDNFQKIQSVSNDVSRHVAIMEEINKRMSDRNIFNLIGLEREIIADQNPSEQCTKLLKHFINTDIDIKEKIRLMLIFCYKYRTYDKYINELTKILYKLNPSAEEIVKKFLSDSLSENLPLYSKPTLGFKLLGEKYTSKIKRIIDLIDSKKLSNGLFPFAGKENELCSDIIFYVVGGVTFSEYKIINEINKLNKDRKITLCSDELLTTQNFIIY